MDLLSATRVFASVARSNSFSATARELGVSTSSVARQMDALEASVGVKLLIRSTRKIKLTAQGQRLLLHGMRALQEFEAVFASVREDVVAPTGILRVTAAPSVGHSVLPAIFAGFLAAYPGIDLDLVLTDAIVDLTETGIDVAIRVGYPTAYSELIVRELLPMRRILCAGAGYLRTSGTPLDPSDLEGHSCLLFRPQDHRYPWLSKTDVWTFRKAKKSIAVSVKGRVTSSDADTLVAAARSNLGIVVMPDWMVVDDLRAGGLVRLLSEYGVGETSESKSLHLAYQVHQRDTLRVKAFCHHVRSWFDDFAKCVLWKA